MIVDAADAIGKKMDTRSRPLLRWTAVEKLSYRESASLEPQCHKEDIDVDLIDQGLRKIKYVW